MKAIMTKVLQPTATKPRRIKAYDGDGNNHTMCADNLDFSSNNWKAHYIVIGELKKKMGWKGSGVMGWMKGLEYVFVFNQ